ELSDLVSALGCGTGKDFDPAKLRYHKICLLMDADSDGNHICTLLLTFFYRHLPELIRQGYVYIAHPPLYRIDARKEPLWARAEGGRGGRVGRGQPAHRPSSAVAGHSVGGVSKRPYETSAAPATRIIRIAPERDLALAHAVCRSGATATWMRSGGDVAPAIPGTKSATVLVRRQAFGIGARPPAGCGSRPRRAARRP